MTGTNSVQFVVQEKEVVRNCNYEMPVILEKDPPLSVVKNNVIIFLVSAFQGHVRTAPTLVVRENIRCKHP